MLVTIPGCIVPYGGGYVWISTWVMKRILIIDNEAHWIQLSRAIYPGQSLRSLWRVILERQ